MQSTASRIARLCAAGSVLLLTAVPSLSSNRADQPVQSWSAMAGMDVLTLLEQAQTMPLSELAVEDQPYCAENSEIHEALRGDFDETRVDRSHQGTELWGSDRMGTWTLVAPRADSTSCIIASGVGFDSRIDVEVYYTTAGIR